jgi:uncharacterized protein YbcI
MQKWDEKLWLFTIDEFNKLPDGIELTSIIGEKVIKGVDDIDLDTRGKCIAFGIEDPLNHKEAELFSIFMLS